MVISTTKFSRNGLTDWLIQRITAILLLCYLIFLLVFFWSNPEMNYWIWSELYHSNYMRIVTLLIIFFLISHTWIGLWTVSTDYLNQRMLGVTGSVIRVLFQTVYMLVLFGYFIWGIQILWGL